MLLWWWTGVLTGGPAAPPPAFSVAVLQNLNTVIALPIPQPQQR